MWEWPPEACNTGNRQRSVDVFLEGNGKLWLYKEHLEWLIKSLWVQQQVKGVAAVASDDEGPDAHVGIGCDVTPEKRPNPCKGRLYDELGSAP